MSIHLKQILSFMGMLTLVLFLFPLQSQMSSKAQFSIVISPLPQCSDFVDNDNDEKVDFPDDIQCTSPSDNSESSGSSSVPSQNMPTNINFSGTTFPDAKVSLLIDGSLKAETNSNSDGIFYFALKDISGGYYNFNFMAKSESGKSTPMISVPIHVVSGGNTQVSNILLNPLLDYNPEFIKDELVIIRGLTAPYSTVYMNTVPKTKMYEIPASKNGEFEIEIDPKAFGASFRAVINTSLGIMKSTDNVVIQFYLAPQAVIEDGDEVKPTELPPTTVGDVVDDGTVIEGQTDQGELNGPYVLEGKFKEQDLQIKHVVDKSAVDLNEDKRFDVKDFMIMRYLYRAQIHIDGDANKNGKLDLVDFSVLAANWTG